MGTNGLSPKNMRKIGAAADRVVVTAHTWSHSDNWMWYFTTSHHEHGSYNKRTGAVELDPPTPPGEDCGSHLYSCSVLFPRHEKEN